MCDWRNRLAKTLDNFVNTVIPRSPEYQLNAVDGGIIMDASKYYINPHTLAELRLVSKNFAAIIGHYPAMRNGLVFHVNGKHQNYKSPTRDVVPVPIRTLTESSLQWVHVKFSHLNLEGDFLGSSELFDKFVSRTCSVSLKSLTLTNISCGLGRLMELLTFCTSLVELKIINCPSIFDTGFEIINWYKYIPPFRKRLANIKHFTLIDSRRSESVIDITAIQCWMSNMQKLVSLDMRASYGSFPIQFLMQVVERNVETLRHFSLVGKCSADDRVMETLARLSLRSLLLGDVNVQASTGIDDFLQTQENLESLHLYCMAVPEACLETIGNMEKLTKLNLEDVNLVGGGSRGLACKHPLTNLVTLEDLRLQSSLGPRKSCLPWTSLFQENPPNFYLTTLVLRFKDAHILTNLFPQEFLKYLKVLVVTDIGKEEQGKRTRGAEFVLKVLSLPSLEKLEITDSNLNNDDFPLAGLGAMNNQTSFKLCMRDLGTLKRLKMLNLSRTHIGDRVILHHIAKLPNLEALYVDKTNVTYKGLMDLANLRNINRDRSGRINCLPRLCMISACNCEAVRLNPDAVRQLTKDLRVQFYCDMMKSSSSTPMISR